MQAALRLAVKDGRPVIPVLLPGAPDEPELPLFLENRGWVDLRAGWDPEGIAKLIWGITGKRPGDDPEPPAAGSAAGEAPTPSETAFLDEIFELLYTYPPLILLAQEDRDRDSGLEVLKALRERARARFGRDKVLHLVPPRNRDANEAEYFRTLGKRAGMDPPAQSAMDFEDYLEGRLAGGQRLFLLISSLGNCSDTGREQLADTLRGLFDYHGDALRVVLAGGEKLAELKYAQGDLSLLSHAEPLHWPELNTGDLMELARRARPPLDLSPEEALAVLDASGHPRLIQQALRCRGWGETIDDRCRGLAASKQIEGQLNALARNPADVVRLAAWLEQAELGPYREWIRDPSLRRLYWKNLLRTDGPAGAERLVWRCPAVIEAGRRVLA